ncbi:hypothetical protein ACWGE1_06710 [Streptomyces sp. NPDC054932]
MLRAVVDGSNARPGTHLFADPINPGRQGSESTSRPRRGPLRAVRDLGVDLFAPYAVHDAYGYRRESTRIFST